jgi:hypothetical protein
LTYFGRKLAFVNLHRVRQLLQDDNVLALDVAGGGIAIGFIILTANGRPRPPNSVVDFLRMFFGELDKHETNGTIFMKPAR